MKAPVIPSRVEAETLAAKFGWDLDGMVRQWRGARARTLARIHNTLLDPSEEHQLVRWCIAETLRGRAGEELQMLVRQMEAGAPAFPPRKSALIRACREASRHHLNAGGAA